MSDDASQQGNVKNTVNLYSILGFEAFMSLQIRMQVEPHQSPVISIRKATTGPRRAILQDARQVRRGLQARTATQRRRASQPAQAPRHSGYRAYG